MVKSVKVRYYKIFSTDRDYITKFISAMETALSLENHSETFTVGAKEVLHSWVILEKGYIFEDNAPFYLISIAKEKGVYPVLIGKDGVQNDIEEPVGDKYHFIVCPKYAFAVAYCGAKILKEFFRQFTEDCTTGLDLYLRKDRLEEVLNWDIYRRIAFIIDAPNNEAVQNMVSAKLNLLEILPLNYSGALKMNLSLSAGRGESLSIVRARDIIESLASEGHCVSLRVTGCDFEGSPVQSIDLKHDPVEYDGAIELDGHYISDEEAKKALFAAINEERKSLIEA